MPRAFGFLPILLLGLQFLVLVVLKAGAALPVEWIGLGLVLTSSTILMTARTVADVHQQRTGGLRPLPWNILAPLMVGVTLSLIGVLVSFYGFSYGPSSTRAVVPTTLIAGALMFVVARQTNQQAFTWIGLVLITITYQSTPTLVSGLVDYVKSNAASAVGESRLPIAFYGLSYIPLLLSLTAVGRYLQRHDNSVHLTPVKLFTTGLSILLLVLSWTHLKAVFPVAAVNIGLFAVLANTYRDQRYLVAMLGSATIAIATWVPFVNTMQIASISSMHIITSLSLFATVLAATPRLDSYLLRIAGSVPAQQRFVETGDTESVRYCLYFGIGLSSLLSVVWVLWVTLQTVIGFSLHHGTGYADLSLTSNLHMVPLAALLLCHVAQTIRTRSPFFAMAMWSMIAFAAFASAVQIKVPAEAIIRAATIASTSVSLLALLPLRHEALGKVVGVYRTAFSNRSLLHSFLVPLHTVSTVIALCLISTIVIPVVLITNVSLKGVVQPEVIACVFVWMIGWKLIFNHRLAGIVTAGVAPVVVSAIIIGSAVMPLTYSTLPLIWTATSVAQYAAAYRSNSLRITSTKGIALIWIYVCALLSLTSFDHVARLTALASLATIAIIERSKFNRNRWTELAVVANMQVLMFIAACCGVQSWFDLAGNTDLWKTVLPFISLGIVCSGALWDVRRWNAEESLRSATSATLRSAFVALTLASIAIRSFSDLQTIVMLAAFAIAATVEFTEAVRLQRIAHIWSSFAVVFSAVGWLAIEDRLLLGTGASQIALITISALSLLIARLIRDHEKLRFASSAFDHVGLFCPAVVVALTLFASVQNMGHRAIGADSAVMLAAAGIYFHRGLATRNRKLVVASAVILNIGLAHLWNAFSLYDLQLYLVPLGLTVIAIVELMKKEIPHAAHNPIRNVGSLIILVSPVFNILGGSWTHLVCLLVLSVLVILLAIGLRVRTLVFMGSGFLFADLIALVIKSAMANPGMLWIGGLGIGIAVIILAAICENHREQLLAKIRLISSELATWN